MRLEVVVVTTKEAAAEFLARKRIAVTGVSRTAKRHGGNVVYQRLRQSGFDVFAVNPNTAQAEGDPRYPDVKSVPGGGDAVVIPTSPAPGGGAMRECGGPRVPHGGENRG